MMKISSNTQMIRDYELKNQQIEQKQRLDAINKKEQLEAERLRAERIAKERGDRIKGSNVDVRV